ncbi:MAG TPA: single-stranded-DNA-specific exonuclease RecJ [Phycisphaerales bacterium]|nr:single-stranded-DNA-specific exonuclease RecJ [Phycisphaerales bacterium]
MHTHAAIPSEIEAKPLPHAATDTIRGLCSLWTPRANSAANAPLVQRVLAARGVLTGEAADAFLNPKMTMLHDPARMPGLDRAAARLLAAARTGEKIVIYGDYDVDGISASAILFHALRAIEPQANVHTYVPHRLEEGYGLNTDSLHELIKQGAQLIVSVDCGITAVAPAAAVKAAGADLIITDHHNLPVGDNCTLPDAYALVHPRLPGSAYPFGDLCGAGVAFKLAWRVMTLASAPPGTTTATKLPDHLRETLLELLGLTSLGVIADVVPLVDENRVIARWGLSRIKYSKLEGLRALVEASDLAGENVKAEDVGFKLGPRLNACGRMGHAREAVELLTTATGPRAIAIAEQLSRQNDQRRATERAIFQQACDLAEAAGMTRDDRRAIVLAHEDWHPGVVGIVCSRLVEKYHRPAILMREHDGICHGSGRSIDGYSLHAGLHACCHHLTKFGGHDMAAGLTLSREALDAFAADFTAHANAAITVSDMIAKHRYDTTASIDEISVASVAQLEKLAPFGRDNPGIRLRVQNAKVTTRPQLLGSTGKHLAFAVSTRGAAMRCVAWNWGDRVMQIPQGATLDLLATPKISTWNGRTNVELEVIDVAGV